MMSLDQIVGRLMDLEDKYYELQSRYHDLINSYEKLKEEHENCSRHRDELGTRYDPFVRNSGH